MGGKHLEVRQLGAFQLLENVVSWLHASRRSAYPAADAPEVARFEFVR